jgi:hypothetical protein
MLGFCCSLAILVAGCSAPITGVPVGPGGTGPSGTGIATQAPVVPPNTSERGDTGDSGSGEDAATCQAIQNLWAGFSEVQMGEEGITQEQVDQIFQGTDHAPAGVQADLKTLHDAAEQAVGQSWSDADTILNTDQVDQALLDLHINAGLC